ncbi:MAG TPA: acetyl-CoA hydrolase/transferase C-terminal domain-containing protein [Haliscomenobacter sp.]|nr:acetyl-CoA hydrolase/transferase C-terminal domain-containing protein [Haliscomenobacter sp.]HOY20300.1 acetyl-CoA hydrolase/transferase C-terminal domain-containing protein [Haliscomenobacter sp.]
MWGRSIQERAKAMIDIAHPDHREQLMREAFEIWKIRV